MRGLTLRESGGDGIYLVYLGIPYNRAHTAMIGWQNCSDGIYLGCLGIPHNRAHTAMIARQYCSNVTLTEARRAPGSPATSPPTCPRSAPICHVGGHFLSRGISFSAGVAIPTTPAFPPPEICGVLDMTAATPSPATNELDAPYTLLAPSATADFNRDGFVHLSGVLSPETIGRYEPVITSEVIRLNTQERPMAERDTYGQAFLQVANIWRENETVKELVFSRRLAGIAAALLGVHGVRIYHDQALYKEPSGGITPWHADQYYWPLSSDRCLTIWLPLQETSLEMGPLAFARGSHNFSHGRDLPISDESEKRLKQAVAEQDFEDVVQPFALGDASFHRGWTFHHAGPNRGTVPRRVMTIIYMDADVRIAEPTNENQQRDRAWMPGAEVGQVPDTPLNPVLLTAGVPEYRGEWIG